MTDLILEKKNRIALASSQQHKASNPDRSVWVEASAGTGKTKVLSDRVLRILLKGGQPSKILCLTYTKAAAVEMNTRIAGRLSKWAVAGEEELEKELESLLGVKFASLSNGNEIKAMARKLFAVLLDTAGGMKIQTIHSFCQEILKRFPLEAKISPYFEVMDDRSANEAMEEVKSRLLLKIEQEPESLTGQSLAFITKNVSEFVFPNILNAITANRNKIARLLAKYASLNELIKATAESIGVKTDDTEEKVLQDFFAGMKRQKMQELTAALYEGSDSDKKKAVVLEAVLLAVQPERFFEDYKNIFLTKEGEVRKAIATKKVFGSCPDLEEAAVNEAYRLQDGTNKLAAAGLFAATKAVLFLADDLIKGYTRYKSIHSKMDYEDLIVVTRQLLENPEVAQWVLFKLDGGIDNVLIDEAQDTSPDQWAIVKAITNEFFNGDGAKDQNSTVFAVGDRKQSIYSFQGADPQEFENMRAYFAKRLKERGNFEEVNMEVSFRSTAAILDTVNQVFADETAKQGVVLEGQDVTHTPSRIGDGGKVELWPLIEAEEGENPDVWLPPVERFKTESTSSRLATQIALRIKKMVEGGEKLVSQNRPLRYRDFMVLVQRRNSFVEELVRACKNNGVEVAGVDKIRLLEQIAIQDLVSLGKFILLPSDDLTLAEVLKSPLFGLDDDDLFKLCYRRGGASLWTRLGDFPQYAKVYKELQTLLNMADFVRPFELYSYVLSKLEGRKKFVSRLGLEVEDGLDEFMNLTLDFEREHIPGLQAFIGWIVKDEVEIKRELEQSELDAVRIMTVHGSKGLQAPVVILPDTVRVKNIRNEAGLLIDEVMYYPLGSFNYEQKCKAIKEKEKKASLEEYRRLLYVALTRAEERLCICGYKKSTKPSEESWYEICKRSFAKIAEKKGEDDFVYEVPQQLEAKSVEATEKPLQSCPDFVWVRTPAVEEGPLAKPLAPSKMEEEDEVALLSPIDKDGKNRYRRGKIIHKLLQFLPEAKGGDKAKLIEDYLSKNALEMSEREQKRIQEEVIALLEDANFKGIFGENSRAEVPIMGEADGKIISGQIDRLVVEENRVLIVDFKTNRPAAQVLSQVPAAYLKQMRAYKVLLQRIYPAKKVVTLILWTDTTQLMEID